MDRLRNEGHAVIYVAEMEPGITDDSVLNAANKESAVLVAADKDFGEIVFRQGRSSSGVVLIRLAGISPDARARRTRITTTDTRG